MAATGEAVQLETITEAIGKLMANAGSVPEPPITVSPGSEMVPVFALTSHVAQFTVATPFGYDVRVTVSKAGGMFG